MKLIEILSGVLVQDINIGMGTEISSITNDSRKVCENSLFIAIEGFEHDGFEYIQKALDNGAVAIICEKKPDSNIPYILVNNTRSVMSQISANFYNNPSTKMQVLGITGTNGKTTSTYLVKHILECNERNVGLIGTNQNLIKDKVLETDRTTPESTKLQCIMAEMVKEDCQNAVLEVSSHSLALKRVENINFEVGAFTNLSQDHLDFHETLDNYAKEKSMLFKKCKYGVINIDDYYSKVMIDNSTCKIITYGIDNTSADLLAHNIEYYSNKVVFDVKYLDKTSSVTLNIPGKFSVYNALTAIGICLMLEISLEEIANSLKTAKGVVGRVEVVDIPADYTVLIDYAHSPDGIDNVLRAVQGFAKKRIIALFGCGGDRDKTKRPLMAKSASKFADICIVTSDNPRTENPSDIIKDIVAGLSDDDCEYKVIEDRREAIRYALDIATTDDIIVLMGKGHETYQEINGVKNHLDEREEVRNYF